jgi:ubiquinone/menaquinone biosynthesis C-methylase UbiE
MSNFLEHTKNSFNKIADAFDEQDKVNPIIRWMRDIVHDVYFRYFKAGDSLLELNSGTGIDAIYLAEHRINIYATDISPKMQSYLLKKLEDDPTLKDKITARPYSFYEIDKVDKDNFDGVISNFGGLNCISNFDKLRDDLIQKTKPGAYFIAVVMNKVCPWEILYFSLKFNFKKAFRRFKKEGIDGAIDDQFVKTFYFTPKEFGNKFKPYFKINRIYTLGLYTPSPYMYGIYNRIKPIVTLWMIIDKFIKGIFPFNRIGDHFIIVMQRVNQL